MWTSFKIYLIYLFLAVLGLHCCARGLSLVAVSGDYSSLRCVGGGFSCGARALGARASVVVAREFSSCGSRALSSTGLVAPWHVGFFKVFIEFITILLLFCVLVFYPRGMWDLSSLTRARTCTPFIGRQSLDYQGSPRHQSFY